MQQMVKLEEEMDRRPATVVWAAETHEHKRTLVHSHTQEGAENTPREALHGPETTTPPTSLSV